MKFVDREEVTKNEKMNENENKNKNEKMNEKMNENKNKNVNENEKFSVRNFFMIWVEVFQWT